MPLLKVANLSISFLKENRENHVVKEISFALYKNEILGLVGESGSGKSVTSFAILGLLPVNTIITGNINYNAINLLNLTPNQWQKYRGAKIAMIFQEPMSALNPSLTCGFQVMEILLQHQKINKELAKKQVIELFKKVKLPRPLLLFNQYPHQLSGGQMQRIIIAMAIACKPDILIADEPTTALDVTVQKEIIDLLKELQKEYGLSILFISHDLSLVSEIATRVLVMYQGKIIEKGSSESIFKNPKQNYTKALLNAKPSLSYRLKRLPTVTDFINQTISTQKYTKEERYKHLKKIYQTSPILEINHLDAFYRDKSNWFFKANIAKAINNVSLKIYEGETVGLVGESGCGKTTLGKAIIRLKSDTHGSIFYKGIDITKLPKKEIRKIRKDIQMIFQDPFSSLNPRLTIGEAITEPMKVHGLYNSKVIRIEKAKELLNKVGLETIFFNRYPHEFSGGQRQRIGIARAIAVNPKIIICDESVSALDVSVQAQVLNLLNSLKKEYNFTYIFISHDLSVVKYMSDQLVVMNQGKIEEIGDADATYKHPASVYTRKLISAIPKG